MASVHSMFSKGRGHGVGCCQGPFVFLEAVQQSPSCLTYISGGAITTRNPVHHPCLLLWWDRVFYSSQKILECFVRFETGPDAEGSQHSSDRLRRVVHIRDDHGSLWECVGLLLVCWVGKGEDSVRISIVCQGLSDMLFLLSLVISKSAETLRPMVQRPDHCHLVCQGLMRLKVKIIICQYGLGSCRLLWIGIHLYDV